MLIISNAMKGSVKMVQTVATVIFVATNGWNLMKLILNIYDHDVVMHVKCFHGVISHRGVIVP